MHIEAAAVQFAPEKADYAKNLEMVGSVFRQVEESGSPADLIVFPETVLTGYFLEGGVGELALGADRVFEDLLMSYRRNVTRPDAVVDVAAGFYESRNGHLYNSGLYATLTADDGGAVPATLHHVHRKFFLPTYGVFDEERFVTRGRSIRAFDTRLGRMAILICEDAWHSISGTIAALDGAQIVMVLSASPGREFGSEGIGNLKRWDRLLQAIAEEHGVWVIYAGLVGFEGGKGFTGSSSVYDPWGHCLVRGSAIEPCIVRARINMDDIGLARRATPLLADLETALSDLIVQLGRVSSGTDTGRGA